MATCPCHPPHHISVSRWPWRWPQRGCLSLSLVCVCVSGLVATEGASVWLPVAVTCLPVCVTRGGTST